MQRDQVLGPSDCWTPRASTAWRNWLPGGLVACLWCLFTVPGVGGDQISPRFRAATQIIQVDVRVHADGGRFVPDLAQSEFVVSSGGRPLQIDAAYVVNGDTATRLRPTPEVASGSPLPERPAVARQAWLFAFDGRLRPAAFVRARKALANFVSETLPKGDMAGLMVGGVVVGGQLTDNRSAFNSTLQALRLPGERPEPVGAPMTDVEALAIARGRTEVLKDVVGRACVGEGPSCEQLERTTLAEAKLRAPLVERAAFQSLSAIAGAAARMGELPGPRSIVLFSEGMPLDAVLSVLRTTVQRAVRHNVRVYVIDARGLGRELSDLVSKSTTDDPYALELRFDEEADVLNSLGVDTGGRVIRNTNNFSLALDEILADAGSYYVLGVHAPKNQQTDRWYPLKVEVSRRGVRVRARRGYVASR